MGQDIFGRKPPADSGKFGMVLHKEPSSVTSPELATALMFAGVLADVKKLGLDPTKIHVQFIFKETGHVMCFNLDKGISTGQDQPFGVGSCN
jgi:hypothetical protein